MPSQIIMTILILTIFRIVVYGNQLFKWNNKLSDKTICIHALEYEICIIEWRKTTAYIWKNEQLSNHISRGILSS